MRELHNSWNLENVSGPFHGVGETLFGEKSIERRGGGGGRRRKDAAVQKSRNNFVNRACVTYRALVPMGWPGSVNNFPVTLATLGN